MPTAIKCLILFANTESFENVAEDFVGGYLSNKIVTSINGVDGGRGQRSDIVNY